MKQLRKRFVFFNMLIISCIIMILAVFASVRDGSTLTARRIVILVVVSIGLVFIGSLLLSKIAIAPIKAAWQKQLDFTADASHELRTPLATIQANLDVVLSNSEATVKSQMSWLNNINIECKRMSAIVSDLLFLSRADTDEINFEKEVFDLSDLLTGILTTYNAIIEQNSLSLITSINDGVTIYGDRSKLKQLIIILLDNAIKYNKDNGTVSVSLLANKGYANIKITDTGIGINLNERDKIFNRFYRGEKSRQKNPDGSGLGLAIAKVIVDEHKGDISLESKIGEGSSFTVKIPLAQQK